MEQRTIANKKNLLSKFITDLGLLLAGSAMTFAGLLIQFKYHMGHHETIETDRLAAGMTYVGWSNLHKISIVIVSILMIFHVILNWKWYETIVRKNLFAKHKQVITLAAVFLVVAFTGYAPWFIKVAGSSEMARELIIEIHDKLALVMVAYLILHVARRLKWFLISFDKLTASSLARRQDPSTCVGRREPVDGKKHVMDAGAMRSRGRNRTDHISADTGECKACWACIDECKRGVLGKVDLWFHRHVVIRNAENCGGCQRCVEVCPNGVFVPVMPKPH